MSHLSTLTKLFECDKSKHLRVQCHREVGKALCLA